MKIVYKNLDRFELKFEIDEKGKPLSVYFKESKDSNKLIEEFMLLANKRVAEFVGKKRGNKTPKTFVYRIHDKPDPDKLANFNTFIQRFGYGIQLTTSRAISSSLNNLLNNVKGKKEQNLVETLAIRTMAKAAYSTRNIGHYGLSFEYYSHFTSPIRRYPDVMVHRLLQFYLDGGKSADTDLYESKSIHCSQMEGLATKAERDSIKYMQVKYMQDHKEETFLGVISGVTEWGMYVEIIENKCEGMIRIRDIKGDFYRFDAEEFALIGERTKTKYQLGDEVEVRVKQADLVKKHLDFILNS